MKSMRKEMRLLQAENMSLRADNVMLQDNMKYLIEKVNSLEDERDDASLAKEGKDPPGSFEEDSIEIVRTDSEKENISASAEELDKAQPTSSTNNTILATPPKVLAYRKRIKSRLSYSPKKKKEEVAPTPEKSYLGLTGRRSQIYKEISRIKTSSIRGVEDKGRRQAVNFW